MSEVSSRSPRRVAIIEDHALLATSVAVALRALGYTCDVLPLAESRAGLIALASRPDPAVVLLDLDLGRDRPDGCELIAPLTKAGARVVVVTGIEDDLRRGMCLDLGALGVLPKSVSLETLIGAVDAALAGRPVMPADERARLRARARAAYAEREAKLAPFRLLTAREAEVLVALINGQQVAAIAERSWVAEATVRAQIRAILSKLGVGSQLAAVALARQCGWPQVAEAAAAADMGASA